MIKDFIKLSTFLMIACAIAAAALSITYVATEEKINVQKTAEMYKALSNECLPGSAKVTAKDDFFVGYDAKNRVMGYAFRTAPKGYGGTIDMVVGIDLKGTVKGIKVLSMKETPGLGTKATVPDYLARFLGRTIRSGFKAKKDFDAVSGATISSQAVANGVKEALEKFKAIKK